MSATDDPAWLAATVANLTDIVAHRAAEIAFDQVTMPTRRDILPGELAVCAGVKLHQAIARTLGDFQDVQRFLHSMGSFFWRAFPKRWETYKRTMLDADDTTSPTADLTSAAALILAELVRQAVAERTAAAQMQVNREWSPQDATDTGDDA